MRRDITVVGGGVVGLATALRLLERWPRCRLAVLEKEAAVAGHQSSHNSGVIHSGVYYRPGTLRARLCVDGAAQLRHFCEANGVPFRTWGKVIVATEPREVSRLEELLQRGQANGVAGLNLLDAAALREVEPHARGVAALHVPSAGVVDFGAVARAMAVRIEALGGVIRTGCAVQACRRVEGRWVLETAGGALESRYLVVTAGLHADRLVAGAGGPRNLRIVPFRGEYAELVPARRHLVRGMIYPVPDPRLPFLGVHLTRTIDGAVHVGPNAILALKREGYRPTDMSARDLWSMASFPGFWRMAARHWRAGAAELWRSINRRAFLSELQRLVPEVRDHDLRPGGAGVRAQAVGRDGRLVEDFDLVRGDGAVFVRNVPSPAATASLAIAAEIVEMVVNTWSPELVATSTTLG